MRDPIIESHSSQLTNYRVANILFEADKVGTSANSTLQFELIHHYFCLLQTTYINCYSIISVSDELLADIDEKRKLYKQLYMKLIFDEAFRTPKNCFILLSYCNTIHFAIIQSLQHLKYLYRTGHTEVKGLKYIDQFGTESIFKTKETKKVVNNGHD